MNSHLHLLEALTGVARWQTDHRVEAVIRELVMILTTPLADRRHASGRTDARPGWLPSPTSKETRTEYGHGIETVWMILDACDAVGMPAGPLLPQLLDQFRAAVRHGFDRDRGGFYLAGHPGASADRTQKIWWVQAEGLLSALHLYRLTGEEFFGAVFLRTLEWTSNHQVDWRTGSWYERVDGVTPSGPKGHHWKVMYHTGRALLDGIAILDDLDAGASKADGGRSANPDPNS